MTGDGIGLRLLAGFEAAKGLLVLLVAFGLAAMLHRHISPLVLWCWIMTAGLLIIGA